MTRLVLVLGDQLSPDMAALKAADPSTDIVLMAEVSGEATYGHDDGVAGLHAGPITYKLRRDAKQFLVVAPGGHVGLESTLGDYIIAYTLPDAATRPIPPQSPQPAPDAN